MISITDHHGPRLVRVAPAIVRPALAEELQYGAQQIVDIARFNINDGAISGSGHVAGAPYDYPKSDTHVLEQSLHAGELIETPGEIKTSAIADAPHAAYVQIGTSKALPRPYMDTATEEVRPNLLHALHTRFLELLRG